MRSKDVQTQRGLAVVRFIKGVGGVVAGLILLYLGATGKIIPAGGLDQSARWGRALGDNGVKVLACCFGAAAILFFGWWVVSAFRIIGGAVDKR